MEPHERLEEAMIDRRVQLGMNWGQLARKAKISEEALRSFRRGNYGTTADTADRLDRALQWPRGTVRHILRGRRPEDLGIFQGRPLDLDAAVTSPLEGELAALLRRVAEAPGAETRLLALMHAARLPEFEEAQQQQGKEET